MPTTGEANPRPLVAVAEPLDQARAAKVMGGSIFSVMAQARMRNFSLAEALKILNTATDINYA